MAANDLVNFFGNPGGFNTNSVPPASDVVPPGKYPVQIDTVAMKPNSKATGHFMEIRFTILDGPPGTKGRKLWDRLNIDNPSEIAVRMSLASLASLGIALNLAEIRETDALVGGICIAVVKVKGGNNEIRAYEPLPVAGVAPPAPVAPVATTLAAPAPVAPVAPVAPLAVAPPTPLPVTAPAPVASAAPPTLPPWQQPAQ